MSNLKVYIDMDGVLADDRLKLLELSRYKDYKDISEHDKEYYYNSYGFFRDLRKTHCADELIEAVNKLFGGYSILTTPVYRNYNGSIRDKAEWVNDNLKIKPQEFISSICKGRYAKHNTLLIDDFGENVDGFRSAGGIALKFKHDSKNYNVKDLIAKLELLSGW